MVKQIQEFASSRTGTFTLLVTLGTMLFSAGFFMGKHTEKLANVEKRIDSKP